MEILAAVKKKPVEEIYSLVDVHMSDSVGKILEYCI